ncbi:MAG: carboxypeptidase regulatory-like domain-containing protein [Nanohaloarchaea archaeon]|nr:carboxypeptidase regulatory-like domain-containing protein [Candidatus Nanohaloarchaea archaeon]
MRNKLITIIILLAAFTTFSTAVNIQPSSDTNLKIGESQKVTASTSNSASSIRVERWSDVQDEWIADAMTFSCSNGCSISNDYVQGTEGSLQVRAVTVVEGSENREKITLEWTQDSEPDNQAPGNFDLQNPSEDEIVSTTPTFEFSAEDRDGDDLDYTIKVLDNDGDRIRTLDSDDYDELRNVDEGDNVDFTLPDWRSLSYDREYIWKVEASDGTATSNSERNYFFTEERVKCGLDDETVTVDLNEDFANQDEEVTAAVNIENAESEDEEGELIIEADGDEVASDEITVDGYSDDDYEVDFDTEDLDTGDVDINAKFDVDSGACEGESFTSDEVTLNVNGDGGTLEVTVTDSEEDPLEDATVEVDNQEKETDDDGEVSFSLEEGEYDIDVSKYDYQDNSRDDVEVNSGEPTEETIELVEEGEEEQAELTVNVVDEDGDALEDIDVEAENGETTSEETDENGEVLFQLKPSEYEVTASDPDYETASKTVDLDEGEEESIDLELSELEDGTDEEVEADFDWSPNEPEAGEEVEFDASDSTGADSFIWDFDENGIPDKYGEEVDYTFDEEGDYDVELEVVGSEGSDTETETIEVGETDDDSDEEEVDLTVSVEDEDNDPIEDAEVEVENGDDESDETDDEGEAYFSLEPDDYEITVSKDGYETETRDIELEEGEPETEDFTLEREDDDSDEEDGELRITEVSGPNYVCRGESFTTRVTVSNRDSYGKVVEIQGTGLDGEVVRDIHVSGDGYRTKNIRFTNVQGSGSENYRVQVSNGGFDSVTRTIDVRDCGLGNVGGGEASSMTVEVSPREVVAGKSFKVSGYVDGVRGRSQADIEVGFERVASTTTQPDGYYQVYVRSNQVGQQNVEVSTNGASQSTAVSILPVATVEAVYAPREVFEGETYEICGDVSSQIDPKVYLLRDGRVVDSKTQSGEVCFDVSASDPGEHEFEVRAVTGGKSGSASTTVEVLELGNEVESFPDQIASVESEEGLVKVDLYNTHREVKRYQLELEGLPDTWVSQSERQVLLDTGEKKTVFFYLTPREEGEGTAEITVSSDGSEVFKKDVRVWAGGSKQPRKKGLIDRLFGIF